MEKKIEIDLTDILIGELAADARLNIEASNGKTEQGPDFINEIRIEGTKAGLEYLAKHILRVANADKETHTHLDRSVNAPVVSSKDDWWLTIERNDKKWRRLNKD